MKNQSNDKIKENKSPTPSDGKLEISDHMDDKIQTSKDQYKNISIIPELKNSFHLEPTDNEAQLKNTLKPDPILLASDHAMCDEIQEPIIEDLIRKYIELYQAQRFR
mgnify:FL=1